jgi:hypothetical protein
VTTLEPKISWTPLQLLHRRFAANLAALEKRYPKLAKEMALLTPSRMYYMLPADERVILGAGDELSITALPQPLPPARALELTQQLYPKGECTQPLLVMGEDQGWLWSRVYRLPCNYAGIAGHRPPLYFVINSLEHLWTILHLQDWPTMLADPRVRLFAGPGAFDQFQASLIDDPNCPWPKLSVNADPSLWPAGMNIDALLTRAKQSTIDKIAEVGRQLHVAYKDFSPETFVANCRPSSSLKILGITSRYTTFLQYSMRDWLAAFERMGHHTKLAIEDSDHQVPNNLARCRFIADFKPDLILAIDHYRQEIGSIPDCIPTVMWIQDYLDSIFSAKAGAAQGPRDFCVGFGKLQLSQRHGYPRQRFLPANIGVNTHRFASAELSAEEIRQFGCDVSYVSHASAPADVLLKHQTDKVGSPQGTRLLNDMYDRMVAHYETGGPALDEPILKQMLNESLGATHCKIDEATRSQILTVFGQSINNAVFRHQALRWLSDLGVDLRLYGTGWEKHPQLAKHARGVANNQTQLRTIYQASKINLQITASGAVHQRLLDGLAAGGFFLIRYSVGDAIGRPYQRLWEWCLRNAVTSQAEFLAKADAQAQQIMQTVSQILGYDIGGTDIKIFDILQMHADNEFMTCADSIWPEYDDVSFSTRDQLQSRLKTYLGNDEARRRVAESMRCRVIEKAGYEHINSRLLDMITRELAEPLTIAPTIRKAAA